MRVPRVPKHILGILLAHGIGGDAAQLHARKRVGVCLCLCLRLCLYLCLCLCLCLSLCGCVGPSARRPLSLFWIDSAKVSFGAKVYSHLGYAIRRVQARAACG